MISSIDATTLEASAALRSIVRCPRPPCDRAFGIQAFEVTNQQHPEVAPGRQPWLPLVRVESLTESFEVAIAVVLVEDLIQLRVERMRSASRPAVGRPHIDVCFAYRRRVPIAIGDSVLRGIGRVDP